jgi:hypothetical protein
MPDGSMQLTAHFDATEVELGTYTANIMFTTNDPDYPTFALPCTLDVVMTGIEDEPTTAIPTAISLDQNFPNPFNPQTEISFGLPANGLVSIDVYDVMGRKVATVANEEMTAGYHSVIWKGTNDSGESVSSGVYFYKLTQGDNTVTKKMIMLK